MDFFTKLFDNPKKAVYLILGFLALFFSYLFFAPEADGAELELGPTYTGEFNGGFGLVFSERFADKYDIGVSLISEQSWEAVNIGNNGNVWAAYVAKKPENWWGILPSEFAVGPNVWIKNQSPINGCNLGYMLNMKWRIHNFSVGVRHWSNAGACSPNRGQDLLTFGYSF